MDHLTYENIRQYIDMQDYSAGNAEMFEQICEHIMDCERCAAMYERMLYAYQLVDDFSIQEYSGLLSLEEKLLERYQIEKLIVSEAGKPLEQRLLEWLCKKQKGLENSIFVYLKDEKRNKISGMIRKTMDHLSVLNTLEPLAAIAVRGTVLGDGDIPGHTKLDYACELSSILVSTDNEKTKFVLDGNEMLLTVQLKEKLFYEQKPPMGILISNRNEIEPLIQLANLVDGVYCIRFMNLQSGEYTFYLDE